MIFDAPIADGVLSLGGTFQGNLVGAARLAKDFATSTTMMFSFCHA
jgi:hypothetical protein